MRDLIIYGAGGLGCEVAEMIHRINLRHRIWNLLGFVDDNPRPRAVWQDRVTLGDRDFVKNFSKPLDMVLAISNPQAKRLVYEALSSLSFIHFPAIIDVDTILSSSVFLGEGVIISHFCSVSVGVKLGKFVFLNTGSHIGHNTSIEDFSSVMPSTDISGEVQVGSDVLIGAGTVILQGKNIASRVTVGIGSVVLGNINEKCTVLGNPARKF